MGGGGNSFVNIKVRTYLLLISGFVFLSLAIQAQTAPAAGYSVGAPPPAPNVTQQLNAGQSPLAGSRPAPLQPGTISLTLLDAIDRGLKYNLGIILSEQGNRSASAARLSALSELMPHLNARAGESVQQVNLAAYGIPLSPGTPSVIGPFSLFDSRALLTETLGFKDLYKERSAREDVRAARYSYQNTRDLFVLVVGSSYLQAHAES